MCHTYYQWAAQFFCVVYFEWKINIVPGGELVYNWSQNLREGMNGMIVYYLLLNSGKYLD